MNYKFNYNNVDTIYKGPGHAVRTTSAVEKSGKLAEVKQVTESDGTILGTLLVTPNCLMFDPDPDHPLVCENGSDIYGMVANMEDIVSVTVYQNISSLTGEQPNKAKDIFDPKNVMGATQKESAMDGANTNDQITGNSEKKASGEKRLHSDAKLVPKSSCCREGQLIGMDEGHPLVYGTSAGGLLLGHLPDERKANVLGSVSAGSSPSNSEQQLPCIDEESENQRAKRIELTRENAGNGGIVENRRTVSDMYCHQKSTTLGIGDSKDSSSSSPLLQSDQFKWLKNITQQSNSLDMQPLAETEECKRAHSSFDQALSLEMGKHRLKSGEQNNQQRRSPSPSSPFSRYSPGMARKSFDKLGRTLSAKATSFKGTVQSGAQSVAHEVVTHTLSAADHIQSGIQNGAKMVASVPGSIMNVSTELLQEGQNGVKEVVDQLKALGESGEQSDRSPLAIKREKSLATLETLCQRTQQAREESVQRAHDTGFVLGAEETPVVLSDCGKKDESRPIGTPPEPPFYMVVRVDRRKKQKQRSVLLQKTNSAAEIVPPTDSNPVTSLSSTSAADLLQEEASAFGNKRKREFWFAIPRSRVDAIYHFLLQWSPQKYGKVKLIDFVVIGHFELKEEASTAEETNELDESEKLEESSKMSQLARVGTSAKKHLGGFVVLEGDVDDSLTGEKHANHFANLNREWEVVTVRELCRRLSLDDSLEPSEMPLPEGALHSQMLDEFMIRQIIDILPPRAEGYPWVQIYNSEKHGFSLTTLYRKMVEWDEEMSPVLLVVRDVNGHVFGAVSSGVLKPCDHYYGTGDSCLLFRFTGEYPHTRELRTFTWTGENQFFVNATRESLSFGAGGGHFGLWLDADLNHGRSQKCATFDNEPLAGGQEEDFVVQFVEVFGFCMS
uniref:Oxidation resistance protein 1 n=1 Tax=Globodera pallida TaxID=36090 RepID=A0A183CBT0_GLOPA